MRVLNEKGQIFGLVNVIDLLVVLLVCVVVVVGYVRLTKPYRIAQPYRTETTRRWVDVELRLPENLVWMADVIKPGVRQVDVRSGEAILEVLRVQAAPDHLLVTLRISALSDGQGRLIYQERLLVPGLVLVVETDVFAFQGPVSRVIGPAAESP